MHSDAQTAFVHSLALLLENKNTSEIIPQLETHLEEDSILQNNQIFKKLLLQVYLAGANDAFNLQLSKKGEEYLLKFESIYESSKGVSINENLIGEAYSSAGMYYFKKGNYTRSKEYINRGLKYAPDNYKLIISKNSL
ncbi:MAG: hypothetical protein HC906_09845 [Bacteroidales bacterium]|nr:hypothetical protein [Bacteroidales bacterium]